MASDNRRTGRTTRMLQEAFRRAYEGKRVVILVHDIRFADYCMNILKDMGAKQTSRLYHSMQVGEGPNAGIIRFVDTNNGAVDIHHNGHIIVRGERDFLVDHEVYHRKFTQVIEGYHKYDK